MVTEVDGIRVIEDDIPQHWQLATFQQLLDDGSLELVQDGNHGGSYPKPGEFEATGIPLVTGADLNDGIIDLHGCKFLNPEAAKRLRIGFAKQGDVLLTHKGTMGKTAIVPALEWPYIILNPQLTLYRVSPQKRLNNRFLKFFFESKPFQAFLERISGISTISTLSLTTQKSLEIPIPPIAEQKAIAAVLGALDDKIEMNRRMNATLKAMAQALFQSWFVDFDPVRAKLDGRQPTGLDSATAALFPNEFEDSELGHIPKGWKVGTLGTLFGVKSDCVLTGPFGSNLHASDYSDEGVPLILVKHVNDGRIIEDRLPLVGVNKVTELARYRLKLGDIVFTRVGAVGRTGYVHPRNVGWLISGQTLRVRIPNWGVLHPRYLAQVYLDPAFIAMVEGHSLGTTRPSLNTKLLRDFRFLIPPSTLTNRFAEIVTPFDEQRQHLDAQSRTLATLRDTLLPKLLSGDLSVKATCAA
jgi:type I restriction enzyme S subunit